MPFKTVVCLLASLAASVTGGNLQGQEPSTPALGAWADKEGKFVYVFHKNNTAEFRGVKSTWSVQKQATDETPGKVEGVWNYEDGICWLGKNKEQLGNTMIYIDSLQCCMIQQVLGGKLVLTSVWDKGAYDELNICKNRVLTKRKAVPDE